MLETASGKEASKEAKQARVDKAALEVASSMANLAQARAEVLQLAAAQKEAKAPPGGDDAQQEHAP